MTKFIDVSNIDEKKEKKETVFTHYLSGETGWRETDSTISDCDKAVYLGKCPIDGDMFAVYRSNHIAIYKGSKGDEFN